MKLIVPVFLAMAMLSGFSCVKTEIMGKDPYDKKNVEGTAWSVDRLPPLQSREDFEDYITRIGYGNKKERLMAFVAIQLKMDMCLPFILNHLEDPEKFDGAEFAIVNSSGVRLSNISIPAGKYTVGSALEMLLASYFYKDPARKTFHPTMRKGSVEAWKVWYDARVGQFRWNSWGLYSNK